jgi:hypothetical protein
MERTGLQSNVLRDEILNAVSYISQGRVLLLTDGKEHEGRLLYEQGLKSAAEIIQSVRESKDAELMAIAEYNFLEQEYASCDKADTYARHSLEAAIHDFKDVLDCLKVVLNHPVYKQAVKILSSAPKNLTGGCPQDVFHQACNAHRARLNNRIRTVGVSMTEKKVLKQRHLNMGAAVEAYISLQQKALA